jgi:hypothetical protein
MLLTMAQVRELITKNEQSEEGVATVWLATAEMGFSLTDEPDATMSQRCKRRESQQSIFSSSNITICCKFSGNRGNGVGDR